MDERMMYWDEWLDWKSAVGFAGCENQNAGRSVDLSSYKGYFENFFGMICRRMVRSSRFSVILRFFHSALRDQAEA
jgi:hypothetical protein